jgi:hypothetical protein
VQRNGHRLRFSLATLLLSAVIAALFIALWTTGQRWKKDAREVQKFRDQVGELTIADPNRVHVIRVPLAGSLKWAWRVYLPANREYRLHLATGDVPKDGLPGPGEAMQMYSPIHCPGEFLLSASVEKDYRGNWVLAANAPGWNGSNPFQNDDWLNRGGWTTSEIELGKTHSVAPGMPIVLVRLCADQGAGEGLMISIQEVKD